MRGVIGSTAAIFVLVTFVAALAATTTIGVGQDRLASRGKLDRREWASAPWLDAEGAVSAFLRPVASRHLCRNPVISLDRERRG
jgi:hypothetical protein